MNSKTSLRIAVVAAFLTVFGTGCASIIREPPKPSPVQGNIVLPKAVAEPAVANMPEEPQVLDEAASPGAA